MPTKLIFNRRNHFFDAETLTHNETECEWQENDAKKNLWSMMIINASSMHTTENRDYIRIDEQIIRIDEEIIRKRERNRRRNIHT